MAALDGVPRNRPVPQQGGTVPLTLSLARGVYQRLEERARAFGYRPTQYAQLLFEAAYAARVAREKGEEPPDAALDRCVTLTFLLAEAEPEGIASALGVPQALVERILAAWRRAGESLCLDAFAAPARAKEDAEEEPRPSPAAPAGRRRSLNSQKAEIARMWAEGATAREIAEAFGCTQGGIE